MHHAFVRDIATLDRSTCARVARVVPVSQHVARGVVLITGDKLFRYFEEYYREKNFIIEESFQLL